METILVSKSNGLLGEGSELKPPATRPLSGSVDGPFFLRGPTGLLLGFAGKETVHSRRVQVTLQTSP